MQTDEQIRPCAEARQLFNAMVPRARQETLHLTIDETIALGVVRRREGDAELVKELLAEEWIDLAADGGFILH